MRPTLPNQPEAAQRFVGGLRLLGLGFIRLEECIAFKPTYDSCLGTDLDHRFAELICDHSPFSACIFLSKAANMLLEPITQLETITAMADTVAIVKYRKCSTTPEQKSLPSEAQFHNNIAPNPIKFPTTMVAKNHLTSVGIWCETRSAISLMPLRDLLCCWTRTSSSFATPFLIDVGPAPCADA